MKCSFILEIEVATDADPLQCREDLSGLLTEAGLTFTLKGPTLAKVRVPNPTLYCDGGLRRKMKLGGWGVVILTPDEVPVELSGIVQPATNNVSELKALIEGLKALKKPSIVTAYTDSQYVQKGFMYLADKWVENGWVTAAGAAVKNIPLWKELLALKAFHVVDVRWVRGHAGNPFNERADYLATNAIMEHLEKGKGHGKG